MSQIPDVQLKSSAQLERALCRQLEQLRLSRNMTQQQLAEAAGVSLRTITRMAAGEGISLDTFIRMLVALGIADNLDGLVPAPELRPVERVRGNKRERQRARPAPGDAEPQPWSWGEDD